MTFEDIHITLQDSVDFVEFMINCNDLIPQIAKAKQESLEEWFEFVDAKNSLKQSFEEKWGQDEPNAYIRLLSESKYIYDIDVKHYADEYLRKIKSQNKFNKLFKQQL